MPTVRNVKYAVKADHNIYIGRGDAFRGRSPLYNPFPLANYRDLKERKENLAQYKKYLWGRMRSTDPHVCEPIWKELRRIQEGSVLNCHCYPLPHCHGHGIIAAWTWAKEQGLLEPVYTNASDESTLKTVARANEGVVLPPHTAPGPLDMTSLLERMRDSLTAEHPNDFYEEGKIIQHVCTPDTAHLMDARRGASILEQCTCNKHDFCQAEPSGTLAQSTGAPTKKRGRGAPRKPRGIVYATPDPWYNRLDEVAADLEELYTTAQYIAETRAVA